MLHAENHINRCCGLPHFLRNGDVRFCCGDQSINLEKEICCEGKIIKGNPKKTTCCGAEAFNPRKKLCCNGRISDKHRLSCGDQQVDDEDDEGPHCASERFNSRNKMCCHNQLFDRGGKLYIAQELYLHMNGAILYN